MAHFASVLDRDDLVVCPYNKAHRVRQGRFQNHLIKCRKNSEASGMETCPFNASHIFPKIEKQEHLATCPFRVDMERNFVSFNSKSSASTEAPQYNNNSVQNDSEENWDDEVDGSASAGYDPKKHASKLQFVSSATLAGKKPAEKRQFRKELAMPRPISPEPQAVRAPSVLSELRPPRAQPLVMQGPINPSSVGVGRGQSVNGSPHRLAANIFGPGVKTENDAGVLRTPVGRGRAVAQQSQFIPKNEP